MLVVWVDQQDVWLALPGSRPVTFEVTSDNALDVVMHPYPDDVVIRDCLVGRAFRLERSNDPHRSLGYRSSVRGVAGVTARIRPFAPGCLGFLTLSLHSSGELAQAQRIRKAFEAARADTIGPAAELADRLAVETARVVDR
ncbi:MAG: hypothetical protein IPM29_27065 [Planctomycetes bacterium]|nr:hypothetical protein [Planctomycetota bacterium]